MATQPEVQSAAALRARYRRVRGLSEALAAPLSDADATLQAMPDASPTKWHLAHSTWFFETFVLRDHVAGYALHDARWPFLFNSYYEGEGERHERPRRGMLSRPSLSEVLAYRAHVDSAVEAALPSLCERALALAELGIAHEEQHQELMLMDLTAAFAANPLLPALWAAEPPAPAAVPETPHWLEGRSGPVEIGHGGGGFAFDCEGPRHTVLLHPHALASRPASNADWLAFMEDGGYARPELWMADGWTWVRDTGVEAPLYWQRRGDVWHRFGLSGLQPLALAEPVCHVSWYEADAFARWAGARLPREEEWEAAAAAADPASGNLLDRPGPVRPRPGGAFFGDVWEWTMSAYSPYPGYGPEAGTVGEYNGKFMVGQFVLRGGSCATPRGHLRASYRNFFYPHQRWMFAGVRLARDL